MVLYKLRKSVRRTSVRELNDQDCSICYEPLVAANGIKQQTILTLAGCSHRFHDLCIMEWINPILSPLTTRQLDDAALQFEDKVNSADTRVRPSHPVPTSHVDYQNLFEINLMSTHTETRGLITQPISGNLETAKRNCPMCRNAIFPFPLHHTDSLELMQVRLRLANLAYQIYGFQRTFWEKTHRANVIRFLAWRWSEALYHQDGRSLGMPVWEDCLRLFKLARLSLRDEAWRYMRDHSLPAEEQIRVLQLIAFFESIKLRNDLVPAFFTLDSVLNQDWIYEQTAQSFQHLNTNLASFCTSLRISVVPEPDLSGSGMFAVVKVDARRQIAHEDYRPTSQTTPMSSELATDEDISMPDAP
ncbi:MAG: hypothetical protein Q9221_003627 [Calogaya cf. arnoldii]